jgi:hypothetical protein
MKDKIRMYGVLDYAIDTVWKEVLPLVERAVGYSYGKFKSEDVYQALKEKEMQLWLMMDNSGLKACVITQVHIYPQTKVMMFVFAAGEDCKGWVHFIEDYKKFAKEQDCDSIEIYGRRGWGKAMKHLGIQEIHTVFKFDIEKE